MMPHVERLVAATLLAEEAAQPLIERLDPPRRAAVVMALLGIVLTGVTLVACVMIGGRWVRRLARRGVRRTSADVMPGRERWREALRAVLPKADSGDTISSDAPSDETKIG